MYAYIYVYIYVCVDIYGLVLLAVEPYPPSADDAFSAPGGKVGSGTGVQGYLAHKKTPIPRTLQ